MRAASAGHRVDQVGDRGRVGPSVTWPSTTAAPATSSPVSGSITVWSVSERASRFAMSAYEAGSFPPAGRSWRSRRPWLMRGGNSSRSVGGVSSSVCSRSLRITMTSGRSPTPGSGRDARRSGNGGVSGASRPNCVGGDGRRSAAGAFAERGAVAGEIDAPGPERVRPAVAQLGQRAVDVGVVDDELGGAAGGRGVGLAGPSRSPAPVVLLPTRGVARLQPPQVTTWSSMRQAVRSRSSTFFTGARPPGW